MTDTASEKTEEPQLLRALYSPSKRQIACVLLASMYGADRRVNSIVHGRDWFTAPTDDMTVVTGTAEEWRQFAASPSSGRPGPEHFSKDTA